MRFVALGCNAFWTALKCVRGWMFAIFQQATLTFETGEVGVELFMIVPSQRLELRDMKYKLIKFKPMAFYVCM
jgi:uncharacterized protein Smg (DUF494 family)